MKGRGCVPTLNLATYDSPLDEIAVSFKPMPLIPCGEKPDGSSWLFLSLTVTLSPRFGNIVEMSPGEFTPVGQEVSAASALCSSVPSLEFSSDEVELLANLT
jgi:hypothetical protein